MNAGIESGGNGLVERVKGIILKPTEEWPKIEGETKGLGEILTGYVLPLAAIGPVAAFIGGQIFGYGALFVSYKPSLMSGLGTLVVSYVLAIVGVMVLMLIADFLAPKFGGVSNRLNAFKLVAYGATAAWLAGVFQLIPSLGFLGLLGLYSIYLFYTGIGPMMKVPDDKKAVYTIVTFVAAVILNMLVGLIAASIVGVGAITGGMGAAIADRASHSSKDDVTINIPGVGSINTGKMEETAKRYERIQKGELKAVAPDVLKRLLPESIGEFQRTGFSSQAMGVAGAGVEGEYKAGDYQFDLKVNDMLALSGLAGLGSAMGIAQEREDENGYERIGTVDGQWRTEKWNTSSNRGTYGVMVAERFQVEASGKVPSIDVLKAAVARIDAGELEDLAEE